MSPEFTKDLERQCKESIEHLKKELGKLRSSRASASLLHGIFVQYYGSSVPIEQLGLINSPESRTITVQVYDTSSVDAVEKAIKQSDLGLNPSRDGNLIRIFIPPLNEERRKDLIKKVNKMSEEFKVTLRGHRRDVIDKIKKKEKDKELSEDVSRKSQDEIQKSLDKFIVDIDSLVSLKEKEMMEV